MHRAIEFLEDGDRIKVTVRFRGRELSHPELGRTLLERFAKQVEEHAVIERMPVLEGKSMFIVLASTHKPKVVETPQRPGRSDDGEAPAAAPAASADETPADVTPAAAGPEPVAAEAAAPADVMPAETPTEAPEVPKPTPAASKPTPSTKATPAAKPAAATNGATTKAAPAATAATPATGD